MIFLKPLTVANFTFKNFLRGSAKFSYIVGITFIFFVTLICSNFSYGDLNNVFFDIFYGLFSFYLCGLALFFGTSIISDDISNRTLYVLLSKPISRVEYLTGRIASIIIFFTLCSLIMIFLCMLSCIILSTHLSINHIYTAIGICLDALFVFCFSFLLSMVANKLLSGTLTIVFYITTHSINSVLEIKSISGFTRSFLKFISFITPKLELINFKEYVLYSQADIPFITFFKAISHVFIYTLIVIFISLVIFNNKNID